MNEPDLWSLLPVAATLFVALLARNVLVGLFCGVTTGVLLIGGTSVIGFMPALVADHLVPQVADTYNASVLVLLAFIGGFVKLMETSGGGTAFARSVARWVVSRARTQIAAWAGGIVIFFSDLGTPLIVGPVMQPLADRLRVSRQKLAFVLDSTSSPVAILVPFIGWGVFIMSVIADAFATNGVAASEWSAFVSAIPYQLYAWLAITSVPLLALADVDFGPMRRAEVEARAIEADDDAPAAEDSRAGPALVWLPLAVLCAALFTALGAQGFPAQQVPGSAFRAALAAAYFFAALALTAMLVRLQLQSLADTVRRYIEGMSGMMSIAATLVLAWALGDISAALGTGQYVAALAQEGVSPGLLPALVFLLAAVISFATGSSWGTIIIMMPLALPAAFAIDAHLPVVIGAVLSGGLFGDHSSPVSETTLLSATGAGTTPLEHFRTQMPYAVANGSLAFGGFLVAGHLAVPWLAGLLVVVQSLAIVLLRQRVAKGTGVR